jgi:two-component system, chemotaxis family, chemotaxis protein CheY
MTFMIIDDSSTMRKIVGLALKAGGYEFTEAENGKDALEKLKTSKKIDFFLVDVNMPEMNGIEFVKNIRSNGQYKNTPVIILTTESEEDKKKAGQDAGANAWIVKPFQKEEILKLINNYVK